MKKKIKDSYHDYVIKNGKFVGEFEAMYCNHENPWDQLTREEFATEKNITIHWCEQIQKQISEPLRIIEIGCGLGLFTNKLHQHNYDVLGMDIAPTAIQKAKLLFPETNFCVGDILDFAIYEKFQPHVFLMAEVSWYVLDKLNIFIEYLRSNFKKKHVMHLLTTYSQGIQQYGREYFTDLKEILEFYNLDYIEYGEVTPCVLKNCNRTYFLASL